MMSSVGTFSGLILLAECFLMILVLHGAASDDSACVAPIHTIHLTNHISEGALFNHSCSEEFGELLSIGREQLRISNQILELANETRVCVAAHDVTTTTAAPVTVDDAPNPPVQIYDSALRPSDCAEVLEMGGTESGVYTIYPSDGEDPFFVFCDMDTDGGGWTVFQRRYNGSVDFYQRWAEYKYGFGRVGGEHWLGNERIHLMTSQKQYELRIDMADWEGETRYAWYESFVLGDASSKYELTLGTYNGTAGDSLDHHRDRKFSTRDNDNDNFRGNCATTHQAGWWYGGCHRANLNGLYHEGGSGAPRSNAINWFYWKGYEYSLKETAMKIRPEK